MKVLIIPDKFKGTLSAVQAAQAIAVGWKGQRPADLVQLLPMSDGGDGFGEVIGQLLGASVQTVRTVNAAHHACVSRWWWEPRSRTAIIESALVVGLAMLPRGKFHPFELDTFGLGAVIQAAAGKGAKQCLIGIGGSATNDGGLGLARSMGWEFLDGNGGQIRKWIQLGDLKSIRWPKESFRIPKLVVAVDVQNPLLGPRGATRIYGPQKGLRERDFEAAEGCLRRLARVVAQFNGMDYGKRPGAGAAGGLGFGMLAFLGARFEAGFDLFARQARLGRQIGSADLVITGEGSIDESTLMGKGVGEIANRCRALEIPCIGLGGKVAPKVRRGKLFTETHALTDLTTAGAARAKAGWWLRRLANGVARAVGDCVD